ncbi:unnamed protein product [Mytilus coruscus]|uniref:Uncharacterized protein n=1 Tax=Mytilus coruscus TaxID=42192 RepID=A0A6J8B5L2_MYTCO|nr:unnamed protein product [Mytilus coruscus]
MSEDFDVDTVFVKFYENKKFLLTSHFQRDIPIQAFFEFIGNYECVLETSSLSLGYNLKKNIRQVFPTESVVYLNIDEFYHDEVSFTQDKINYGSNYNSDSSLPDPKLNETSGMEAIDLTQSSPEKSEGRLKNQNRDAGGQLIIRETICFSTSSNDETHGQFTDEVELPKLKKHLKRKRIRKHQFLRDIESSESEEETPKAFVIEIGKRKLPHSIFNNVALERVKFVPEDINGTKNYQVPIDSNDKFKYMRDERNWGRFKPSKRAGFFWNSIYPRLQGVFRMQKQ